jgi:hypothetical protein
MATFQNVIDDARVLLNDSDKTRYSDALLLSFTNQAIAETKRIRPDLFFGTYSTALSTYILSDTFPLSSEYQPYVHDYIIGRSNSIDDEYTLDGRATAFLQRFKSGMIGI